MDTQPFNARFVSLTSLDRLYRVCFRDSELYFIRIGGQGGVYESLPHFLGPLGGFVGGFLKKRAVESEEALSVAVDESHPVLYLRKHRHNFKLNPASVKASSIKPPAALSLHGAQVGRWTLALRDGKKMTFQFESIADMNVALLSLPGVLGHALTIDVEWNRDAHSFVRRRQPQP